MSPALAPCHPPVERRRHQRFPVRAAAELMALGIRDRARISNLSTGGILLKTQVELSIGEEVEVFIAWPCWPHDWGRFGLTIGGTVLRRDEVGTAIAIWKYDFHRVHRTE